MGLSYFSSQPLIDVPPRNVSSSLINHFHKPYLQTRPKIYKPGRDRKIPYCIFERSMISKDMNILIGHKHVDTRYQSETQTSEPQ
jgi:hypothetical protein